MISEETVKKLEDAGIKTTKDIFEKAASRSSREELVSSTGICDQTILQVTKLSDLSRIKWVGVTYAQMLFDLGIDTVEKVAGSDPGELHALINQLIKDQNIFKGAIGLNDVHILIETAGQLTFDIEY